MTDRQRDLLTALQALDTIGDKPDSKWSERDRDMLAFADDIIDKKWTPKRSK